MINQLVKEQFNKQAEKFANWSIGKNVEYLNGYFDFCDIKSSDKLLDIACGPGEFTIFIAKRIKQARGIDISDKEIEIANNLIQEFRLENIGFDCDDVENLPYKDNTFSVVVCKSAFHHFTRPDKVFKEMIRCCEKGGLISIQDIRSYEDNYVNDYFETFDKLIDLSHNKTLSERDFTNLYINNGIKISGDFKLEVDLKVNEYIDHAVQDESNIHKIQDLLEKGKHDSKLRNYLFLRDDELYFRRTAYLIKGNK
ncbi:MAG: class I SAM-dependent methyltransferase [Bacteroidales bacterium]